MLNSRYAPVVALAVLAIILVVVLGWFLAIKPQLDERTELRETSAEVVSNTDQINNEATRLAQYESELEALPDYSSLIATHSPEGFEVDYVRARLTEAIRGGEAEIFSLEHGVLTEIEGWTLPADTLPSAHIARLFQTGPVHVPEDEPEFEPAVAVASEADTARVFYGIPVTVGIAGAAPELLRVLELLEDPDEQLFQLYSLEFEQRPEGSPIIDGVSDPVDGDATLVFTGFFYLEGVAQELTDQGEIGEIPLGDSGPFVPVEGNVDQPGANPGTSGGQED